MILNEMIGRFNIFDYFKFIKINIIVFIPVFKYFPIDLVSSNIFILIAYPNQIGQRKIFLFLYSRFNKVNNLSAVFLKWRVTRNTVQTVSKYLFIVR